MSYHVGDLVFWILGTASGEAVFIGHPKTDKSRRVLILATDAEIGFKIDAEDCRRTGLSYPNSGRDYRQRYAKNHPGELVGNP
jgi:hypothetical protein